MDMQPVLHLNYLAVIAAAVVSFFFSWFWFGPLFGKTWGKLMNFPADMKPTSGQMTRGMILGIVGCLLTSFVLVHSTEVWRPSVWKAGADQASWIYGFFGGLFTWLGFYIPQLFNGVAWEGRPWKLFGINAVYAFLNLQIIAQILANWRAV